MIANLAWYFWVLIALFVLSNAAMLVIGYVVGINKGKAPDPEQGDQDERSGSWGHP